MNALIPIAAALASWVSALILDQALFSLHLQALKSAHLGVFYWGGLPLAILFAAIMLASIWAIAVRAKSPRWIGLPMAILAVALLLSLPFATTGLSPLERLLARPLLRSQVLLREAAPTSLFMIQTSAIMLSGLFALFRRTEK